MSASKPAKVTVKRPAKPNSKPGAKRTASPAPVNLSNTIRCPKCNTLFLRTGKPLFGGCCSAKCQGQR